MTYLRHFVVSLCVVLALVSCAAPGDSGLQLTIDAQSTRLATIGSETTTPDGERTEASESAEAAGPTGMVLPGETWKKGETEITLSNATFEPGCRGMFGFQLEITNNSSEPIPPFTAANIQTYNDYGDRCVGTWWVEGQPTEECYPNYITRLQRHVPSGSSVKISFVVKDDPTRGVSRVEVTIPRNYSDKAVWDIDAFEAQDLQTETPFTEESTGTSNGPTPAPEGSFDNRPALLWSSVADSFAISDGMAFVELEDGRVQARGLESGNFTWESQAKYEQILAADSDNVYVIPSWQRIDALDAATGEANWTALLPAGIEYSLGMLVHAQTASDLFVYLEDSDNQSMYGIKIARIDKNSGLVELLPFRRRAGRLDVVGDGVLVVDREIGWSPSARRVLWEISDIAGETSLCNGLLIFSSKDGLSALEIASGDTRWTVEVPHGPTDVYCKPTRRLEAISNLGLFLETMDDSFGTGPHLQKESDRIYVRTRYSYDEAGPLVAVDKQTGELTIGLESNVFFIPGSGEYAWLGEVEDMLVYAHEGFGVTEAYDEDHTTLLWQNKEIVLWKILGVLDDKLIGMVWEQKDGRRYPKILAGLDTASGEEHWRTEIGRSLNPNVAGAYLVSGRLLYSNNDDEIIFLDPVSGSVDTILSPGPVKYAWSNFTSIDGVIVSWTTGGIAVIAP